MNWHNFTVESALKELNVSTHFGLSNEEVLKRQKKFGTNEIHEGESVKFFKIFFHQFKGPLIYLLFIAAIAAFAMEEFNDGWVILFVVTINSVIGAFQESRAEKSLKDLKKISFVPVRVTRNGNEETIEAKYLVPGDIVSLNAGDAIAADMRLIEAVRLETNEAVLTGESIPVSKSAQVIEKEVELSDRLNMLYSATFVTAGRARAVVIATGLNTEVGEIAELTGKVKEPPTPLSKRVEEFSRILIYISICVFFLILGIGLYQGISLSEIVMLGISQVVSIVPEGLPVAMTIAAAVGVQRMAAKKTIVRKLSAVETLGATTVICSDKTGTLTQNRLQVVDENVWKAEFRQRLYEVAVLCNDGDVTNDREMGDPTETALLVAAAKHGIEKKVIEKSFPRINEIPFDVDFKMMATEHYGSNQQFIALKGAPDSLLRLCNLSDSDKRTIEAQYEDMARRALRVLAFAWIPDHKLTGSFEELSGKAHFLGLLGQIDPPREEVKLAIENCKKAGIRPVMITGDHKLTGFAIAKLTGLASESDRAIEGKEIEDNILEINQIAVFARVRPSQKLRLVEAFQNAGQVVAMTGDGVNDAPALCKADVGVAMGITGTEVAKEAAKIVVTDDNFATIVSAIAEGRLVYQNIKKVVLLLVSTSFAELLVLLLALISGLAAPFAAVQILWNNLVTEGIITVNVIMDPAEGNEMDRAPISPKEALITPIMWKRMAIMVPTIVTTSLGWFAWRVKNGIDVPLARTETLTLLVFFEWFNVLNCRSETKSAFNFSLLKNKWLLGGLVLGIILHGLLLFWRPLGKHFYTVPIDLNILPQLILLASLVLWAEELRKFIARLTMK